jgi:hypothetical protein
VLRRTLIGSAFAALVAFSLLAAETMSVLAQQLPPLQPLAVSDPNTQRPKVAEGQTCPTTCQAEHDRCRVQRKGSPSCDADRQACLEKCLKQKRR